MKHTWLWTLGVVVLLVLMVLAGRNYVGRQTHEGSLHNSPVRFNAPAGESVPVITGDAVLDAEIARVQAMSRQYVGLTPEAVRAEYRILHETNQVPGALDMTAKNDQTGETVSFAFEKGKLYRVYLVRANGSEYKMDLWDGRVGDYSEGGKMGYNGLCFGFYTNGQLEAVAHFENGMWLGAVRYYDETGALLFSTNCMLPTLPELPPHLRPPRQD